MASTDLLCDGITIIHFNNFVRKCTTWDVTWGPTPCVHVTPLNVLKAWNCASIEPRHVTTARYRKALNPSTCILYVDIAVQKYWSSPTVDFSSRKRRSATVSRQRIYWCWVNPNVWITVDGEAFRKKNGEPIDNPYRNLQLTSSKSRRHR